MPVLKNKKAHWVKLATPEKKYMSEETQWSMVVHLSDEESRKLLKAKMITKERFVEVDGKDVPYVKLVKSTHWRKSGDAKTPVKVVDMYGQDLNAATIGNGSTVNVQFSTRDYEFNGMKGKSIELMAVQVIELVEYTGSSKSNELEFDFLSKEEVSLEGDLDLNDDIFE